MRIEEYLAVIDARLAELARQAVGGIATGPDLEQRYMRVVGVYAGLTEARQILLGMAKDKAEKDDNL